MPYDESNIDHVCTDCGRVVSGPHKDEHIDAPGGKWPNEYKGAGLSHTQCESCQMVSKNEQEMTAKYGKDWRTEGQKRKALIDAETAGKKHPWWEKLW